MTTTEPIAIERSVEEPTTEQNTAFSDCCPECEGRLLSEGIEDYCEDCGLVVAEQAIVMTPGKSARGPRTRSGPVEWAVEPSTPFRVDHGLGSGFNLGRDGRGRELGAEEKRKFGRLKRLHKRMDKRDIRLNEGLRDVEMLGGQLTLPRHVTEEAADLLRQAAEARLPGGRMAWESLAGATVLLSVRNAGLEREIQEVARYAKTSEERLCAAARKVRVELGLVRQLPPVRPGCVTSVVDALDGQVDPLVREDLRWLGERLLWLADERGIGPGTTRLSMAAVAVYAAGRLIHGRLVTQQEMADAASTVLETSKSRIGMYAPELLATYEEVFGSDEPAAALGCGSKVV